MEYVYSIEWDWPNPDGSNDPNCSGYTVKRTLEDAIAFCKEQWPGETIFQLTPEQAAEAEGMPVEEMRKMMLPTWTNTHPNTPVDENSLLITICEYNDQGSASPKMWRMLVTKLEEEEIGMEPERYRQFVESLTDEQLDEHLKELEAEQCPCFSKGEDGTTKHAQMAKQKFQHKKREDGSRSNQIISCCENHLQLYIDSEYFELYKVQ